MVETDSGRGAQHRPAGIRDGLMAGFSILQFGQTGQVGRELIGQANLRNINIIALGRADVDLVDDIAITQAIENASSDVRFVVNAAAYTAVDDAESDQDAAFRTNHLAPAAMAKACASRGLGFIHLSTDYVFDGSGSVPYREQDAVSPLGVYGHSKLAGESAVRMAHGSAIILRTSWVFSPYGKNFLKTMLGLASRRDELSVVSDQIGCPTSALAIADVILDLVCRHNTSNPVPGGVYNVCGVEKSSWYDFAKAIFKELEMRELKRPVVYPVTTEEYPTLAARPKYSVLDCGKIEAVLDRALPPWRDAIPRCVDVLIAEGFI